MSLLSYFFHRGHTMQIKLDLTEGHAEKQVHTGPSTTFSQKMFYNLFIWHEIIN